MELDELKQSWQQENEKKNERQLQAMMTQRASSVFSRVKLRAIIESVALLLTLLVFFTGLDADRNAAWVNILFASALLIGIANNWMLYRRIAVNAAGANLLVSLQSVNRQLQWQIRLAVVFSVLLFVGTFAFLVLRIPMTEQKLLFVLFALPASIGIRTWFEVRRWQRSRASVEQSIAELADR